MSVKYTFRYSRTDKRDFTCVGSNNSISFDHVNKNENEKKNVSWNIKENVETKSICVHRLNSNTAVKVYPSFFGGWLENLQIGNSCRSEWSGRQCQTLTD